MAAQFIVLTFPISFVFAATSNDRRLTWLYAMVSSLVAIFLFYTRTRAAWLSVLGEILLIGGALFFYGKGPERKSVFDKNRTLAAVAALLMFFIFINLRPALSETSSSVFKTPAVRKLEDALDPSSIRYRLILWKNALSVIARHPVAGVGIRNIQVHYPTAPDKRGHRLNLYTQRVHNDYLQMYAELGLPVLVVFCWILVLIVKAALKTIRGPNREVCGPLSLICLAAIFGLAINAFFSFPFNRAMPPFLLAIYLGLFFRVSTMAEPRAEKSLSGKTLSRKTALVVAGGWGIIFLVWGVTSYHWAMADHYYRKHVLAFLNVDYPKAVFYGNKALAHNPERGAILRSLSRVYVQQKDYENAETLFARIDKVFPHSSLNLYYQAAARINQKRYDEAEKIIQKGLAVIPHSGKLHGLLGVVYQVKNQTEDAIREYRRAIELAPGLNRHYEWLGQLQYEKQQLGEARQIFSKLLEVDPENSGARMALGRIRLIQYRQRLKSPPGLPDVVQLAMIPSGIDTQDADLAKAVEHFSAILISHPHHPDANNCLGVAWFYQGKKAEGTSQFCKVLRGRVDHRFARNNLQSVAGYRKLNVAAVVNCYLDLIRIHPDNADLRSQLGLTFINRGQPETAENHFREAVRLAPDSPVLRRYLGVALTQQGKLDGAILEFQAALQKSGGQDAVAHNNLGSALARLKQMDVAIDHFRLALKIDPHYADARANLQKALQLTKQSD